MFDQHFDEKLVDTTIIGERGQIVIPAKIRDDLKLKKGDKLIIFAKHNRFIGLLKADEISGFLRKWLEKIEKED